LEAAEQDIGTEEQIGKIYDAIRKLKDVPELIRNLSVINATADQANNEAAEGDAKERD